MSEEKCGMKSRSSINEEKQRYLTGLIESYVSRLDNNDPTVTTIAIDYNPYNVHLSAAGFLKLCKSIGSSKHIRKLKIKHANMDSDEVRMLANAFRENTSLTEINLSWNSMGP